jgi:adsorption protein A
MSSTVRPAVADPQHDVSNTSAIRATARDIGAWLLSDLRRLRAFPHLDRAYRLIEREEWQSARHELETFIQLQPDYLEARRAYVLLLYRLTSYGEVIREADALDARGDRAPDVWLYRGLARHARHEDRAAVDDFRRAVESGALEPDQRRFALSMLADVAIGIRQYEPAFSALESLTRVQDTFSVRFLRGVALDGLNRPNEAGVSYGEALAIAGDAREQIQAYTALADNATKRHAWDDARRALVAALGLEPHNTGLARRLADVAVSMHDCDSGALREILDVTSDLDSRESLGHLLYSCGDYRGAADQFRSLTSRMAAVSGRARVYTALGHSYESLQEHHQASAAFERAAALTPTTETLAALGRSRAMEGRTRAAITTLRSALAVTRSHHGDIDTRTTRIELLMEIAGLELTNGDRAEALRDFGLSAASASNKATKSAAYRQIGFLQQSMAHLDAARTAFEHVIDLTPDDVSALSALGEINLQLGAVEQSVKFFAKSAAINPSPAASQALAAAYAREGRLDDALAIYRRLLGASDTKAAESVQLLTTIASLEFEAGHFAEAATAYTRAFDLDPASDSDLLIRSGRAWAAQGDWDATVRVSLRLLERAALPAAVRAETFSRLGLAYLNQDRIDEAIEAFRYAVALLPDSTNQRSLAFALFKRADYAAALREFRVIASGTSNPGDWIHVALCLDRIGKPGLALTAWQRAASRADELSPADRFTVFLALGDNWAHEGQSGHAIENWAMAWSLQPTADVGLRMASAYRLVGRATEALDLMHRIEPEIAAGAPHSALQSAYLDELSELQLAQESFEAAAATLGQALNLQRTSVRLYERGMCFFKLHRFADAEADFRAAVERDPTNDSYVQALGYVQKELGQYREAARAFKRAIELEPDRLAAYSELGDIALRTGDGKSAAFWFNKVIDNRAFHPVRNPEQRAQLDRTIQRLRQQDATLARPVEFAAYVGTGPSQWHDTASPLAFSGQGSIGAAEVMMPVPTGASSLARPLKVVGRLFWPVEPNQPGSSPQFSVGFIYKPFAKTNLNAGLERLFVVGPNGTNRWLLRGAYSKEVERSEHSERQVDPYGLVFTEGAYAIGGIVDRQFSLEGRRGLTISIGDSWRLSPHVLADVRYQSGLATYPIAFETGGGIHIRRPVGATPYVDHRAIFDTLVQYRGGRELGPQGSTTVGGWTWMSVLHF